MDATARIERTIEAAIARAGGEGCPPLLADAVRYAVFPGGARVRPQLCLAVAASCGDEAPAAAEGVAAAIELLHCASLVHDDLPCFDDADARRGKLSVHRKFGEPLAVLAGDALIVAAFEALAHGAADAPDRLAGLLTIVTRASGMPNGIVAGQAWESEPAAPLETYQRAKTGSLFIAATMAGAAAGGGDPQRWRAVGAHLGDAYQVADDVFDAAGDPDAADKPLGRDHDLGRPNAVRALGVQGALARLRDLVTQAADAIPPCDGAGELRKLVMFQARRLVPSHLSHSAA